jgi:hypothetical protein
MDQHQPILSALASTDPEVVDRMSAPLSRRAALKGGAAASAGLATALKLASAPVALAALARDAFGQDSGLPQAVVNIFNFALTLEELEAEFYVRAVDAGILPANVVPIFTTIRDHELAHVAFLRNALGSQAIARPRFDFTGGRGGARPGPYADVFSNYNTLLAVAQAFEDTGVRAYKGQAPALRPFRGPDGNNFALQAALQVHSVEARHAAQIRRLRGTFNEFKPLYQGWVTRNATDVPGAEAVYAGEENTTHAGVNVATLVARVGTGATAINISTDTVTESFDEPLTMAQVLAIVAPFIAA